MSKTAVPEQLSHLPKAFTIEELAAHWRCERQLLYRRIRRGKLRAFKVGGLLRVPWDEVARVESTGPVVDADGVPIDDIEAHIAALVAKAPKMTDEQRIRISAMLLTGTWGAK